MLGVIPMCLLCCHLKWSSQHFHWVVSERGKPNRILVDDFFVKPLDTFLFARCKNINHNTFLFLCQL